VIDNISSEIPTTDGFQAVTPSNKVVDDTVDVEIHKDRYVMRVTVDKIPGLLVVLIEETEIDETVAISIKDPPNHRTSLGSGKTQGIVYFIQK